MFDIEKQDCAFAEQIAEFLYGELETRNRAAFETHLSTCAACADELSGFKTVRASILDWRALEFDRLASPAIEIETKKSIEKAAPISRKTASWLDSLRKVFSPSPALAFAAALIFTAICVALVAYNFGGKQQIAEIDEQKNSIKTVDSTTQNSAPNTHISEKNGDKDEKQYIADILPASKSLNAENGAARKAEFRQTVRTANGARVYGVKESAEKKVYNSTPIRKISDLSQIVAKNNSTTKIITAPKLSSIEDDEEDATLRLTDLLDDAGGK